MIQVHVLHGMGVRVPPSAPGKGNYTVRFRRVVFLKKASFSVEPSAGKLFAVRNSVGMLLHFFAVSTKMKAIYYVLRHLR